MATFNDCDGVNNHQGGAFYQLNQEDFKSIPAVASPPQFLSLAANIWRARAIQSGRVTAKELDEQTQNQEREQQHIALSEALRANLTPRRRRM